MGRKMIQRLPLYEVDPSLLQEALSSDCQEETRIPLSIYADGHSEHLRLISKNHALSDDITDSKRTWKRISDRELQAQNSESRVSTILQIPDSVIDLGWAIETIQLSPAGTLALIGGRSGKLVVFDRTQGLIRTELHGHVGDITTCRFFPSGEVLLSGALDGMLKVWGLDGSNPGTLVGHKGAVTDAVIISRGKNILSASKDGSVKLWETASGSILHCWELCTNGPVNAISIGSSRLTKGATSLNSSDPREVDTQGKILIAATESGNLSGYNLGTKEQLFSVQVSKSQLDSVAYHEKEGLIACGSRDGKLALYDIQSMDQPFALLSRSSSAFKTLKFISSPTKDLIWLVIGNADGAVGLVDLESQGLVREFIGRGTDSLGAFDVIASQESGSMTLDTGGRLGLVSSYRWTF